jgi:hypothetical protein
MDILKAKCRICKSIQPHQEVDEFKDLPKYVVCLKCLGCGVMGIELRDQVKNG